MFNTSHMRLFLAFIFGLAFGAAGVLWMSFQGNGVAKQDSTFVAPFTAEPNAFHIFPCTSTTDLEDPYSPCILVIAGGKRLVFGAPQHQDWRSIGPIDAVFLFNGHPSASGGLIGLRNQTWMDGRDALLLTVSGDLQLEAIQEMDQAQLTYDALLKLEQPGRLELPDAGFRLKPVPPDGSERGVFDTGDLQVFAKSGTSASGDQWIAYQVSYGDQNLQILPCGGKLLSRQTSHILAASKDTTWLTEQRRAASTLRQTARIVALQRIATHCPTKREVLDEAVRLNVDSVQLIGPLSGEAGLRAQYPETSVQRFLPEGWRLQ